VIWPVAGFSVRPAGSAGETEYVTGATPFETVIGVNGVAGTPAVSDTGVVEPSALNAGFPVNVKDDDELSGVGVVESVAVITNVDVPEGAVKVPVMAPVEVLNERPAGSEGAMAYVIGAIPPAAVTGVKAATATPTSIAFVARAVVAETGA